MIDPGTHMMKREKQKHGKEEDEINIITDGVAPQSTQKLQVADVKVLLGRFFLRGCLAMLKIGG